MGVKLLTCFVLTVAVTVERAAGHQFDCNTCSRVDGVEKCSTTRHCSSPQVCDISVEGGKLSSDCIHAHSDCHETHHQSCIHSDHLTHYNSCKECCKDNACITSAFAHIQKHLNDHTNKPDGHHVTGTDHTQNAHHTAPTTAQYPSTASPCKDNFDLCAPEICHHPDIYTLCPMTCGVCTSYATQTGTRTTGMTLQASVTATTKPATTAMPTTTTLTSTAAPTTTAAPTSTTAPASTAAPTSTAMPTTTKLTSTAAPTTAPASTASPTSTATPTTTTLTSTAAPTTSTHTSIAAPATTTPTSTSTHTSSIASTDGKSSPTTSTHTSKSDITTTTASTVTSTKAPQAVHRTCYQCGSVDNGRYCTLPEIYIPHAAPCPAGTSFCMTDIEQHIDGTTNYIKRCVNQNECDKLWYQQTSDRSECVDLDPTTLTSATTCRYCCTSDNCNAGKIPAKQTLYNPKN